MKSKHFGAFHAAFGRIHAVDSRRDSKGVKRRLKGVRGLGYEPRVEVFADVSGMKSINTMKSNEKHVHPECFCYYIRRNQSL